VWRHNVDGPSTASTPAESGAQNIKEADRRAAAGSNPPNSATSPKAPRTFAASLRGTQRDGRLQTDENGNLVVERGIRDLFDYHLTTLGEHGIDTIRKHLLDLFQHELPEAAARQAAQLLDAYLQYRERSGELQQQYPALNENNAFTTISDYFAQRENLRHELFTPEAVDAFFSADQAGEREALPKLQRLAGEIAPATLDTAQARNSYAQYRQARRAASETGNPADDDALRTQLFGHEASTRLAALDLRRSDWRTRLNSYREQKQQLMVVAAQAGIDPARLLQQLRQSQFSEREILRVRALDKLEQIAP
jgi:lipase chaperone LimK